LGWVWSGVSGPGSTIFAYDYCADSADDAAGVVYFEWSFFGWTDGFLFTLNTPEGLSPIPPFGVMTTEHGVHMAGIGANCENCGGGGGGGEGSNTNQFHLDVTNQLVGISNVVYESHRWQRGELGESERSGLVASVTNGWAALVDDARAKGRETLGSATNLAQVSSFSAPAAQADDFFVGDVGLFGLLEGATVAFSGLVGLFRTFCAVGFCFFLGVSVREELQGMARDMVTVPQVPAMGSDVPLLDLVLGKARGFLLVSVLMSALPLLIDMFLGAFAGFAEVGVGGGVRDPMPLLSALFADVPKFGRAFALLNTYLPFEVAMGCAVTYTAFKNLKLQLFVFACWFSKLV